LQGGENLRLLHQSSRERGVERRQAKRAILEHFHQLTAGAEQQHRAKLRVDAAAQNQLVAVGRNHRLDGTAEEVLRARPFAA